jgi:hypothetical protein
VSVSDPFDVGAVVTLMKYYGRFDVYCMPIFYYYSVNKFFFLMKGILQDNPFRHRSKMENTFESFSSPQHKKVFTMVYRVENVSR